VLLISASIRLDDLALFLLAEKQRETLALRRAATCEAAARHRIVEFLCILAWDAHRYLN